MPFRPISYVLAALGLVVLQIAVFNQVQLWAWARPIVYPMLILILPFGFSRAGALGIAFAAGLLLDAFSDTPGLHAAALVALAFWRPNLTPLITPTGGYESGDAPRIGSLGPVWYIAYAALGLLLHHTIFFGLEAFSFGAFGRTLVRILSSTILSAALVWLLELAFGGSQKRR